MQCQDGQRVAAENCDHQEAIDDRPDDHVRFKAKDAIVWQWWLGTIDGGIEPVMIVVAADIRDQIGKACTGVCLIAHNHRWLRGIVGACGAINICITLHIVIRRVGTKWNIFHCLGCSQWETLEAHAVTVCGSCIMHASFFGLQMNNYTARGLERLLIR